MSDSHHLGTSPSLGEVEHITHLSEHIGSLFWNEDYSDIVLLIEGQRIPSHKVILASRSEYFRALLYGGLRESQEAEVELKGTSLSAFKVLLKYIYTGHMTLASLKEEMVLDILGLAHQYGFVELETAISDYLKAILNIRNVCMIYDMASLFHLSSLADVCCSFVDRNALDIIHHESFLTLSASALKEMISRDSFCASEVDIFRAVCEWAQQNPDVDMREILSAVRLPLMALPDLLNVVRPTGLVSADTILDAIKARTESRDTDLKYRGYLMPEENVASPKHGAQVLHGELRSALLDGDVHTYDMERGFTRHPIDDNNGQGILVMLGRQCIINHMHMLLWDRDIRSYSYYIEVSVDQKDWVKVIDHTRYLCRSWQQLYFKPRVVRYIRIVGTHNTVNRVFHLVSFECMYTNSPFRLEKDLLYPLHNVATVSASAWVTEGVSRSRNALINGDTENYDWDSGYTCHQLGSGAIVVQLAQPFILDSMRMLLWDCDDRSYSYYIEVSTDQQHWHMVTDKRNEACRGWQTIIFPPRPVVFIRIVGTHNTANEVFHCVHFECPAQIPSSPNSSSSSLTDVGANFEEFLKTESEQQT
ncbi:BTB/POZ domain-containing protein 9-like [Stegodyphus dumicola]|uniref:BTB/POZ domain-containing protein 9-like n=1 Tax=Stegodyphus dumicola TaxID=202533 RepID=UPI0015B1BBC9|nr:BTB/POZ domain-containing protein 9-like [Stegodyphus dumicola]XP_035227047.1 BTB/POZ domain-containing protein 9-like [Stegodyphus dumicola]XP_035227048.1 BTB/POZ domain-containing protein 9-like [Stegodyphus dumicola]